MSKEDLIQVDGKIAGISGGGQYSVLLENGMEISAKLGGKMKKFKIRIVVGDRVQVSVSPYDSSHGLITLRHKA
jgi:translation initiation factor IF-1